MKRALAMLCATALACGWAGAAETVPATDAHVVRMGRTAAEPDGALRFSYPGVTLRVAFTGTRLVMDAAGGEKTLLEVIVDGGAPVTVALGPQQRSIELVRGAAAGRHTVEVVQRTETWLGITSVARFATDGRFEQPSPLPARKLLVLGDSVTCGANMERPDHDRNNPQWWNGRVSYGMLLGRALDAQVQLVCYGGRGLVRSYHGGSEEWQLPDYYRMAIPDGARPVWWKQADYAPDLILVAIGTNDFTQGIPEAGLYVSAYETFVRTLLRDHPRAQVALTEGAILNGEKKTALTGYLQETAKRVGSPRVHVVASQYHPGDAQDAHPTTAQHVEMAKELAPLLKPLIR